MIKKIGGNDVIWSENFICPEDQSVEISLDVNGISLDIVVEFAQDESTKKAKIQSGIRDNVVVITFTNWNDTPGVMTPYDYKVAVFNKKLVKVAAHGAAFSGVHRIFMQFMMEDYDDA